MPDTPDICETCGEGLNAPIHCGTCGAFDHPFRANGRTTLGHGGGEPAPEADSPWPGLAPDSPWLWPGLTPDQVIDGPAPWYLKQARERCETMDREAMIRELAMDRVREARRFHRAQAIEKELRSVFERVCGRDAYPDGNYACGELAMIQMIGTVK